MTEPPIVKQPLDDYGPSRTAALSTQVPANSASKKGSILDQRWFVLAAIFLAMMFLGLPLLWRCPAFSRLEKVAFTIITLIYSAVVFWIFFAVMSWSWRNITDALG